MEQENNEGSKPAEDTVITTNDAGGSSDCGNTQMDTSSTSSEAQLPNVESVPPLRINIPSPAPVTPGIKDSDGFLTPPPASTLLIRRARTNSIGSSTFVAASSSSTSSVSIVSSPEIPLPLSMDIRRSLSVPHRRLQKKVSRDRRSDHSYKRVNFDNNKVNVLLTPQGNNNPHVKVISSGNGLHHRSSFPPISPLAIDPSHALSVTLSSDRSISTVVPIDSTSPTTTDFNFPMPTLCLVTPNDNENRSTTENTEPTVFSSESDDQNKNRGKPLAFSSDEPSTSAKSNLAGKGKSSRIEKRKRGERGPDRFPNIDPATGRRKYVRKKRFTLDKRTSSRARLQSRMLLDSVSYDHELTGKWRPTDDLRLIVNVLQTNDLESVYRGVKFSCKFTLENIERRWAGLLYDKAVAKVTQNAIRNIHPRMVAQIHEKSLFSAEEDRVLKSLRSTHDPKVMVPVMEKFLKEHALVFLKWRTPKRLIEHWMHLREYHLLCDQNVKDYFDQESFSEYEDNVTDHEAKETYEIDPNVRREMLIENKHTKKMIRVLEEEVSRWQVMADMVTEIEQTPFEEGSFAMLRGKQVRYLMRSREITLGRRTAESMNVDADLSLEGSTYKVSRRQATIQLRPMGDFAIWNQGKHGIYVDGIVIMPGKLGALVDQSVIEISQLRFVFLINHKMVNEQRKKLIRLEVKKEMVRLAKIARFIKNHPASSLVSTSASAQAHPQSLVRVTQPMPIVRSNPIPLPPMPTFIRSMAPGPATIPTLSPFVRIPALATQPAIIRNTLPLPMPTIIRNTAPPPPLPTIVKSTTSIPTGYTIPSPVPTFIRNMIPTRSNTTSTLPLPESTPTVVKTSAPTTPMQTVMMALPSHLASFQSQIPPPQSDSVPDIGPAPPGSVPSIGPAPPSSVHAVGTAPHRIGPAPPGSVPTIGPAPPRSVHAVGPAPHRIGPAPPGSVPTIGPAPPRSVHAVGPPPHRIGPAPPGSVPAIGPAPSLPTMILSDLTIRPGLPPHNNLNYKNSPL